MSERKTVVGLGELLWDMLPEGPQLGGAVSNFAVMAARLGNNGAIATRIGTDPLGREAMAFLKTTPVDTSYIQEDFSRVTGTVTVTLDDGQPQFTIHEPVAWDFLEFTPHWLALAEQADAVCFGSLAQRSPASRRTIESFLHETRPECVRIFDVNLRAPFFSSEIVEQSLELATIFKLNADEMPQVLSLLGFPDAAGITPDFLLNGARQIIDQFPVQLVAITLGPQGSLLVTRNEVDRHPGYPGRSRGHGRRWRRLHRRAHPLLPSRRAVVAAQCRRQSLGRLGGLSRWRHARFGRRGTGSRHENHRSGLLIPRSPHRLRHQPRRVS